MDKLIKQKEEKPTELQVIKTDEVSQFINKAIENNLPVETMERLFALHREFKADNAREGFVLALASFQKDIPIIKKTKKVLNKDGRTIRYMYAPMDSVIEQIKKPLANNGLAYTWDSSREEIHIKVVCKLTHVMGHSEQSTFDIPIVQSEYMSSPQSYATAQSYAKRYTLLNVLGIGTADEDTDATDTDNNKTAKSKKAKIVFLLRTLGKVVNTKEQSVAEIKKLTQLDANEKTYDEIIERLEIMVKEKQGL